MTVKSRRVLVGCDIGTSGTKAAVVDGDGTILASQYKEYALHVPRPGWAEHHPDIYWSAVSTTISAVLNKAKIDPHGVAAISISGLSPACILVDERGNPLTSAHIWMDRRGVAESKWVAERIGVSRIQELTGNGVDPYYGTVKLLWEARNRLDIYRKAFKTLSPSGFAVLKLTGRFTMDYSNASVMGIVFDIRNRCWNSDLMDEVGLAQDKFPDLFPCDMVVGEVTNTAAKEIGIATGTPVVAGTVDCNAAWLASGAVDPGNSSLVMGTAGIFGVVHREPHFAKGMMTIVHTAYSKEYYTTVAAIVSCGSILRYFRDEFGHVEKAFADIMKGSPYDWLTHEASQVDPGANGLVVLPYFMGERTPVWDPLARGVMVGWSLAHSRRHILRALMEAPAYAIRDNVERMEAHGIVIHEPFSISEGGAISALWRQIMVDVLGRSADFSESFGGAPVGNAINAGVGVGLFRDYNVVNQWDREHSLTKPDETRSNLYDRQFRVYKDIYPRLRSLFPELIELQ